MLLALIVSFQLLMLKNTPSVSSPKITEKINISGHWEGTITRDEGGGKRTVFKMELDLQQNGKNVVGTSYVHAEGDKKTYSANMELVGKFKGSYFKYDEMKILQYDPIPDAEWCIKRVELIYKTVGGNIPTMEGVWEGRTGASRDCIPGRVFLKKTPPRV